MVKAHPSGDDIRKTTLMLAKALAPSGVDAEMSFDTNDLARRLGVIENPRRLMANVLRKKYNKEKGENGHPEMIGKGNSFICRGRLALEVLAGVIHEFRENERRNTSSRKKKLRPSK